jgi:hypothetical protein
MFFLLLLLPLMLVATHPAWALALIALGAAILVCCRLREDATDDC